MSLIVNELSQILYRVVVLCPEKKDLRALFEDLSFELTTHKKLERRHLELAGAALTGEALQTWLSFTLGRRSNLNMRVSLAGFSADHSLPSTQLLSFCDGILIHAPHDTESLENFFSLKLPDEVRQIPVLCTGFDQMPDDFRKRAALEFIKRNFSKILSLRDDQSFLNEGLEWYFIHG